MTKKWKDCDGSTACNRSACLFYVDTGDWSSELSDQDPSDEETTDMETENLEQDK